MKTLLLLSLMLLSLSASAQYKKGKLDNPMTSGLILTGGGVGMTLGAFFTPNEYYWVGQQTQPNQSNANAGTWEVKPFYKQGAKFYGVCGGVTLTISGLITTLSNLK